jgi:hypothetical protein
MAEQSHRDEMSAAIRAQRARNAVPKTIAPEPEPRREREPEPRHDPAAGARAERKGFFARLRAR